MFYNCLYLTTFVCNSRVFRPIEMVEYIYFYCFSYGFSIKKYVRKESRSWGELAYEISSSLYKQNRAFHYQLFLIILNEIFYLNDTTAV